MDSREERGRNLARKQGVIKPIKRGLFAVKSETGIGEYRVEQQEQAWKCSCPDYITREAPCKHVHATRFYLEAHTPDGEVTRIRLTYGQAWKAYNAAQADEVRAFDALLADLCATIKEPEQHMGRPRIPLATQVFCAVQKAYSQLSLRRAASLFKNAEERAQLERAPHFNAPSKLLNRADVTPLLHELLTASAVPLASIEHDFAVDSSGFRTTGFGAYCAGKYGQVKPHEFLKAHIMVGANTHVITRAIITHGSGSDSPHFAPLVRDTSAAGFKLGEVTADKAYSSRLNLNVVREHGGIAYIPFKSNTTGTGRGKGGGMTWLKAFHFFQYHREEFDAKYHKRSNVESVFSSIKRKLGETLKSRNKVAQENELLCKLIAYNITVLISAMHEHGIQPDFAPQAAPVAK